MAKVIKSRVDVATKSKLVKEEVIRYQSDGAVSANQTENMYKFEGTSGDVYEIRNGECAEILAIGTKTVDNLQHLKLLDRDKTEWNGFYGGDDLGVAKGQGNELPFHAPVNFERMMMSWGYRSFLQSDVDIAKTLKMPEGDEINMEIKAGAVAISDATDLNATIIVIRRYLSGSNVDYRHFNNYDGGLKSNKWFYSRIAEGKTAYQQATTPGAWTSAWYLQILKSEAYKIFSGGVHIGNTVNLVQGKLVIDDPTYTYNSYFCNVNYNQLPFTDSAELDTSYVGSNAGSAVRTSHVYRMHRFSPTIDVMRDKNKDLTVYLKDNGTSATKTVTRLQGIKYLL